MHILSLIIQPDVSEGWLRDETQHLYLSLAYLLGFVPQPNLQTVIVVNYQTHVNITYFTALS